MDTNNTLCDEIDRIVDKLKSTTDFHKCISDSNGHSYECKEKSQVGADCIVNHRKDGLLILKGSCEFMVDAMSNFVIPATMSRIKKKGVSVAVEKALRLLEHHALHLSKAVSEEDKKEKIYLSMETQEMDRLYRKHGEELQNGLDPERFLSSGELELIHRNVEQWTSCIRGLHESVGFKRSGFHEEKTFWSKFYMEMCYIREFGKSEVFGFVHDVLKRSKRFVSAATLESLMLSNKYFELGRGLHGFYEGMDFKGVYFPRSLDEFKDSTVSAIKEIGRRIGRQSKMARKLILSQMDRLVWLIIDKVHENLSIGWLKCCEELLLCSIESMCSLTVSREGEESEAMSLESSLFYEFRGGEELAKFHSEFKDIKKILLFSWSFKGLGAVVPKLLKSSPEKAAHEIRYRSLLQEMISEIGDPDLRPVVGWMKKDLFNIKARLEVVFDQQEGFVSDVFNEAFERICDIDSDILEEGEKETEVLGVLLPQEDGDKFHKLCKVMKMFSIFNLFEIFARKTVNNRMMIVRYLDSIVKSCPPSLDDNFCNKLSRLFMFHDMFGEVWKILDLFFGQDYDGIVQLWEIRRMKKSIERQVSDTIYEWENSVLSDGFSWGRIVSISREADGNRKFKVSPEPTILKRLDEYMTIVSLEGVRSRISQPIHETMALALEARSIYTRIDDGCRRINRILEDVREDLDLFHKEIDLVFGSMEKILMLRWKDAKDFQDIEEIDDRVRELENRVYTYRFLLKKIAKEEMKAIFSKQIQKQMLFSLDSETYLEFFKFYEKSIVVRGINRSMSRVFLQYLESVLEALEAGDSSLFSSKHRLKKEIVKIEGCGNGVEHCFEPPLSEYFKILEKIFPSEGEGYFFEKVLQRLRPGQEIRSKVEKIIGMVVANYETCTRILELIPTWDLPLGLYERFLRVRDSQRSVEMFVKNTIPFFTFEHTMDASEQARLFETVCDEVCRFVSAENSRVYDMLAARKDMVGGMGDSGSQESSMERRDLLEEISNSILVDEYLRSEEFRILEELNGAVIEYGLERPSVAIETVRSERDSALEANREALNLFLNDIPFGIIKSRREALVSEIRDFGEKIDNAAKERDGLMFWPMFKSLKTRYEELEEKIKRFNKILGIVDYPLICSSLQERIGGLDAEWATFSRFETILKKYESQKVCDVDVEQLSSFLKSIDVSLFHAEYYKEFQSKIKYYISGLDCLQHTKSPYVKKKYFDTEMETKEFFLLQDKDEVEKRLADSRMEYEVERYIERARAEIFLVSLKVRHLRKEEVVIPDLSQVEERVNKLLVEHDSISRFNEKNFFIEELNGIKERMDDCLSFLACLEEVQRGIREFANVFSTDGLDFEAKKYSMIKKRFLDVLNRFSTPSSSSGWEVKLGALLPHKDEFLGMKKDFDDISKGLKVFLRRCRERTPRLYLVSDIDLIRGLNSRSYYVEMLGMMFNIDGVIVENGSILGFEGNGETVMLRQKVQIDQDIGGFMDTFEEEVKRTLKSWFHDGLESLKEGCPSIISDLISEFKYFNKRDFEMTPKLRVLEREIEKHPNGVIRLYPKPVLKSGELFMDSTEEIEYGFEYYPPVDIVFTPLVCRVLSSIAISLKSLCGVILYGRSGTGKTESVKYYCRLIGKPVFVFCCNEGCELETLRNVISGAVLTGSYLCFDEFNRLSEEIMSGATELILLNKNKTKFFLTMNIGYKGRYRMPRSLRAILGETRIDAPDIKDIIDYYCKESSEKIYRLMREVESKASKQDHYDFGLRAVRTITKGREEAEIMRSAIYFYMACLGREDKAIFVKEFEKIFERKVEQNLAHKDMLLYGLENRRGALVIGGNGAGKSTLIKLARESRGAMCFYYNPRNIGKIFGFQDKVTGEWKDSKFVRDLRRNMDSSKECWFVFDGIAESFWIEDFNSILDENKLLCLSSGERIRIPDHYRFVFESTSMENITPATLTRVFLVHMEEDDLYQIGNLQNTVGTGMDIRYDGRKVPVFPFRGLVVTEEQSFYARAMEALVKDGSKVFFMRGEVGVGKRSLVEEVFKEKVVVIEGNGFETSMIAQSLGEDKIKRVGEEKIYDLRSVVYIEGFDCRNVSLVEAVREYNECGRIGEIEVKNMVLICGINEKKGNDAIRNTAAERLRRKIKSIFVEEPRDTELLFESEIRKRFEATKHFQDYKRVLQVVEFIYKNFKVNLKEITSFIRTLGDLCMEEGDLVDLMYFEAKIYFGESKDLEEEMQRAFGRRPEEIEFNLETRRFRRAKRCSDISYVGSIFHRGYNLVIEGGRMSGKHWVVRECMRQMKENVRIVSNEDEKKIDGQTAFLVEDVSSLRKDISNQCMIFKLKRTAYYSLDLLKIYNMVRSKDISDLDMVKECFTTNVGINIDLENEGIPSETSSLAMGVEEDGHPWECQHPNVVTTGFLCKAIGFGMSFARIAREFKEKESRRRKFLIGGLQKIEDFGKEALALGLESSRKKKDLEKLTDRLDGQLEKIINTQKQLEREKGAIGNRKREIEGALMMNQKKQEVIDKRLRVAKTLLSESRRSIEELPKSSLSEIRVMINPPEIVRNTVEAVYWIVEGETKGGSIEWKQLIQFMKREDFVSKVLNCRSTKVPDVLENMISNPLFSYEKAQKASSACGPLFMWVMARYKYAKTMEEISPLDQEIAVLGKEVEKSRKEIEEEEKKLLQIEKKIEAMKDEYNASVLKLESIKKEIKSADERALLMDKIVRELSDEVEKWRRMKYLCPIKYILSSTDWVLHCKRNGFVHSSGISALTRARRFISTSLEDKNYKQVLSNCSYYGNDVIVYGCDRFDKDVYRALKRQMDNPQYSIILVSSTKTNPYKEYTYNCSFVERFETEESGNLERLEERLLELIVEHAPLNEVYEHKKKLEKERSISKQHSKKREVYEILNLVFGRKSKIFFEAYGVHLSFRIYREYVENVIYPILESRLCRDNFENMWAGMVDADMNLVRDVISRSVDSFYSSTFPDTKDEYEGLIHEMSRHPFDYTLIIACDIATHIIEEKMAITAVISAGPKENNEKIYRMLEEESQEDRTYLIKNIHFLGSCKKSGNSRLILTIEEGKKHSLMEDTKVVYCKGYGTQEGTAIASFSGGDEDLVKFHVEMSNRNSQFGLKDLMLCAENMGHCDREYLKTIVYGSRLDV
ncbi:dynein heavy chain [Encephalitozoon intestinalis]